MSNLQNRPKEIKSSSSNDPGSHRGTPLQVIADDAPRNDGGVIVVTNQSSSICQHPSSYTIHNRKQIRNALKDALGCQQRQQQQQQQQNDHRLDDNHLNGNIDWTIDWTTVYDLLLQLDRSTTFNQQQTCSNHQQQEDDPDGRIFLTHLLARNPPMNCLDAALDVFPDAVGPNNPVAFFTACSNASQQAIAQMMQHVLQRSQEKQGNSQLLECPYPWILLPFISVEAAQVMLDMYPQGIWESSSTPFLTSDSRSYSPLDYILFSSAMSNRRDFDETMWLKFKLILVTANNNNKYFTVAGCEISPVHTFLDRVLTFPGEKEYR
jgi:hypothetical protein